MKFPLPPKIARRMITDGDFRKRLANDPEGALAEMGMGDDVALVNRVKSADWSQVDAAINDAVNNVSGGSSC
jgi:hypothetical protein